MRALLALALTGTAFAATLTVPGAAPGAAAAEPCRQEIEGVELPDGAGRYPLIDQLGLHQAWDLSTGQGVTVAVIDSGVDGTHPDLDGAVASGSQFVMVQEEKEFERTTPAPHQDCEGHGTGVAGLIAAQRAEGDRMAGVAPGSRVYPVRMADGVDQSSPNALAAAIGDAVDSGASVLNLSLAIVTDNKTVRAAIEAALAADVVVVAAAGNESNQGVSGGKMYPAAYPGVVAVGAVGNDAQPLESSNSGAWVDIAGYGESVTMLAPNGSGYLQDSGNSFAAAQVSGTAALIRSRFPDLSADEVIERLTGSATPVSGGRTDHTGSGIVDPFGALTYLGGDADVEATEARPGGIPIQAVPREEPLLAGTAATAVAWSAGLLLAVVLGLLGAPAVRRAARRGWRPGPDIPGHNGERPERPSPPPTKAGQDWLDGSDVPAPPAATARTARSAQTFYTS